MNKKAYDEKGMYIAVLIFSAVFLFWNIHDIMFTVHDDMRIYTISKLDKVFQYAVESSKKGRITHLWNTVLLGIPFMADSVAVYKFFSFASVTFDALALYILLKNHAGREMAYISVLIFFSFAVLSPDHNLLTAYVLCHQIPIGFLLFSFDFDLNYLKSGRKKYLVFSVIFYLIASMIYEAFIPFILFYAGFSFIRYYNERKSSLDIKRFLINFLSHFIPVIIYVAVYFLWRMKYTSSYDGNELYFSEPFLSLKAIYDYSTSFSPVFQFFELSAEHSISFGDFISSITFASLLKAMAVSFVVYRCFPKISVKIPEYLLLIFSGAGIFIPNLITGFTKKYAKWDTDGHNGYISSFYSYFFLVIFMLTAVHMIYSLIKSKKCKSVFLYTIFAGVFFCCITADITTDVWGEHYRTLYLKYRSFDEAVSGDFITGLDDGTDIYIPDNVGIHANMDYTQDYVSIYTDKKLYFHTDISELDFSRKTVCMRCKSEYNAMVMGYIDSNFYAKTLYVAVADGKTCTVRMVLDNGSVVDYENLKNGDIITAERGRCFDLS